MKVLIAGGGIAGPAAAIALAKAGLSADWDAKIVAPV